MAILMWIILAWVFIKCVGWTLEPFLRRSSEENQRTYEIHHHYDVDINVSDSFNTDNSDFKGGAYYGIEKESTSNSNQTSDIFGNFRS